MYCDNKVTPLEGPPRPSGCVGFPSKLLITRNITKSNGHISLSGGDHYQERLTRLESDKESLVLQVSVLTDQVEAQGEKIRDLDICLDEHREKLNATEEMLQQELLCRTTLETQKLELISEVSNLKLKLNSIEKNRLDFDERFRDSEDLILEINELRYRITDLENEKLQYEKKLKSTKDELNVLRRQLEGKDGEMRRLQDETGFQTSSCRDPSEKDVEVQRMKKAVESLMAANEEKDRKIEELKQSLQRYKKVQDMVMSVQGKKEGNYFSPSESRLQGESSPSPSPSDNERASESTPTDGESEEMNNVSEKPPLGPSSTLPASIEDDSFGSRKARSSFGKGFFKIRGGKKTSSTPNLAETERPTTDHLDLAGLPQRSTNSDSTHTLPTNAESRKKAKGITKLFGKLKRSRSTSFNLDDNLSEGEFKRGGVRATAGPRLGWSVICSGATTVTWTLRLRAGPKIRFASGSRSRAWVFMSTWAGLDLVRTDSAPGVTAGLREGAGHQTSFAQEEAAARASVFGIRGGRQ
ncbi:hypothetical protein WMY93_023082 [Mugilogobius chulae]|uniref:Liprin-beta-1/2 coiled-coil domain-containing protein n=1 Tax=Mugilogobius chulae TaxID=88201 RepID=A0AAW0N3C3_9GOBI